MKKESLEGNFFNDSENILKRVICIFKFNILIYCGNLKSRVYKIILGETVDATFAVCHSS